jgi:hypothetical protein
MAPTLVELILDKNILVAALRSKRGASYRLIRLIAGGRLRVNISVALALEYEEVLKRAGLLPGLTETDVDRFLDYLLQRGQPGPIGIVAPTEPAGSGRRAYSGSRCPDSGAHRHTQ